MTVIDERDLMWLPRDAVRNRIRPPGGRASRIHVHRPVRTRPGVAPLRYGGTGIAVSRASHQARKVSAKATVALAGLATPTTLRLGGPADFSGGGPAAAQVPEQLAVVRVQAGETLQELAQRVAPEAPVAQVVRRIADLNQLGSASVQAGQTLIAPIS